jgi:hypothetical protein
LRSAHADAASQIHRRRQVAPGAAVIDESAKRQEFAAWLAAQPAYQSPDARYLVRRAVPDDFPRIWNLVDLVWSRTRPRHAYEWLYLKNPCGFARGTVVYELSSGALVSSAVRFPWPVACGNDRLRAAFGGDTVTLPRLQRTGLTDIRRGPGRLDPWQNDTVVLAAPNEKSRANARKQGDVTPLGPLPSATMILDFQRVLADRGLPGPIARTAGGVANAARLRWLSPALPFERSLRVEAIQRFDASFDALAERCMRTDHYWCPHDAEFLNWRYLDHVLHDYMAIALVRDDVAAAYSVARVSGGRALLMEFAADRLDLARPLLLAILDRVRAAGCHRISFHATSGWRYWNLLRSVGFRKRHSERYIKADCPNRPDVPIESNWQLLPGDSDVD